MSYIESMLAAVPAENKDAYYQSAEKMAALFCKFGAIRVVESWGVNVPEGELTSMPKAVSSSEAREAMPMGLFDTKHIIFGGFEIMVDCKG